MVYVILGEVSHYGRAGDICIPCLVELVLYFSLYFQTMVIKQSDDQPDTLDILFWEDAVKLYRST
jgi:hypothetical protein